MLEVRCSHCSKTINKVEGQKPSAFSYVNPITHLTFYFCSQSCKEKNLFLRKRQITIVGRVTR